MDQRTRRKALASISGLTQSEVEDVLAKLKLQPKNELALLTDLVLFAQDFGLDVKALAEYVAGKTTGIQRRKRRTSPVEGAWRALIRGNVVKAESLAKKLLKDVDSKRGSWDEGNLVHHGNLILGHIRLREDDLPGAEEHLLAAGRTPGSPQLNSFGPNMTLAKALLERGRTDLVLQYFKECARFWDERFSQLGDWAASAKAGNTPQFGPNLAYGGSRGWRN